MRKKLYSFTAVATAILAALAAPPGHGADRVPLAKRPSLTEKNVIAHSPDKLHVAWAQTTPGGKAAVAIDGRLEPAEYDDIELITFSPDGGRLAYLARSGRRALLIVDGKPGPLYDDISLSCVTFSPDGKRLAYGALRGEKWYVVLDGKEMPASGHDFVGYFAFSPDGGRFVYAAGKGRSTTKQAVVVDGRQGPYYEMTGEPVFSPDGKRLAYVAIEDHDHRLVVVDGKPGKKYNGVNKPVFSSDGRHVAYSAIKGEQRLVVVDGREGPGFEMPATIHPVLFSPKGNRLAYAAMKGEKWVVVVDGRVGPEYDKVIPESLLFSPDGKRFAYVASRDDKWFVVTDGVKGPEYDGIVKGGIVFSPDGARLAYGAWINRETPRCSICVGFLQRIWLGLMYVLNRTPKDLIVLDGKEGPKHDEILPGSFVFSPNGGHFLYIGGRLGKKYVYIDGKKADTHFDRFMQPAFKGDEVEYLAERDSDGWLVRCRQSFAGKVVETKLSPLPRPPREESSCSTCPGADANGGGGSDGGAGGTGGKSGASEDNV